ncbi:MAG: hypothetical protein ACFFD4_38785 [Candidatus Odinarchaeota archaeon]
MILPYNSYWKNMDTQYFQAAPARHDRQQELPLAVLTGHRKTFCRDRG